MRAFYAVARREFLDKRFVLIAAVVAAVIPLIVPLVRHVPGIDASDARQWLAVFLGSAFAGAVAVGMGTTVPAGEIANRRIAFFFSRPISSFSLWAGKLGGGFLLAVSTLAIAIAPVLLVDRNLSPLREIAQTTGRGLAIETGLLLFLLLIGNAAATILRSHSWLSFLDLVALAFIVLVGWLAWTRLPNELAYPPPWWTTTGVTLALFVAAAGMLAGSYRAVSRGRIDASDAHRAFSSALWSVCGITAAAFLAYSQWALAAPPSSLSLRGAAPLGSNGWVGLEGRARGLWAFFLYDTRTARWERRSALWAVTSADGRIAAWVDRESATDTFYIRTLRLDTPGAISVATTISLGSSSGVQFPYQQLSLSPDGDRVAVLARGILSVFELPSGNSLGSARVADDSHEGASGFFASRDEVRVLRHSYASASETVRWDILQFDLQKRTLTQTGSAELQRARWMWPTPSGAQILVRESVDGSFDPRTAVTRISLHDSRTGALLATLHEGVIPHGISASFLSSGSIALAFADADGTWLETFSALGEKRTHASLGGGGTPRIGGEWASGRLLVGVTPLAVRGHEGAPLLLVANLEAGTVRRVAEGLRPVTEWWKGSSLAPGSEATKLFLDTNHSLVRFDPATGERRVLLQMRADPQR